MPYHKEVDTGANILKKLEHDSRVILEYGVPLSTMEYRRIITLLDPNEDETDMQNIENRVRNMVESEACQGRFGAFVLRWDPTYKNGDDADYVEVWSWNSS